MKRLYGVLLLVLAALMFFSCKREPAFEPDPILTETTVGVYGLSGADHVYKPLKCQLSRTYDANGALTLRILSRKDGSVCQVSPIQGFCARRRKKPSPRAPWKWKCWKWGRNSSGSRPGRER